MTGKERDRVPDGIRVSATGRVPQWVLDDAAGRPGTVVPFRGPTGASPAAVGSRRRRSRRGRRLLGALVVLGGVGAAAVLLDVAPPSAADGRISLVRGGATSTTVQKPSNGPTPGFEESPAPLSVAPSAADPGEGSAYRFLRHQDDGVQPLAWSPCRPVHVVTRPDNAPPGGALMITDAMERISAATGLTLVDGGFTTEAPSREREPYQPRYGDRWAPVLVAWATTTEVPDFASSVAGLAGPSAVQTPSGDGAYVSGHVYLDPAKIVQARVAGSEAVARAIVLHEVGHLVGLDHVEDEAAVMFPESREQVTDLSPGDRAGLARLGRGTCQPDV